MHRLGRVTLNDGNLEVTGVEIWGEIDGVLTFQGDLIRVPSYVDYRAIPFYLVRYGGLRVFTTDPDTETWFKDNLVALALKLDANIGLIYQIEHQYLIFYFDKHVKCFIVDFEILNEVDRYIDKKFPSKLEIIGANTNIFDKICEKRNNPFVEPIIQQNDASVLSNQTQVNLAISKIILSGLRIRGLSTNLNHSVNEKLTIKEIYQMTYKATLFSLRKYNYSFNKSDHPITVNELQEIIEKLLEIFVDVS